MIGRRHLVDTALAVVLVVIGADLAGKLAGPRTPAECVLYESRKPDGTASYHKAAVAETGVFPLVPLGQPCRETRLRVQR